MWPINSAIEMREKREAVIMACLTGGQHIDAAIEAADRLYPEDKIKEADDNHQVISEQWLQARIKATEDLRNKWKNENEEAKTTNPWFSSAASRWWTFYCEGLS